MLTGDGGIDVTRCVEMLCLLRRVLAVPWCAYVANPLHDRQELRGDSPSLRPTRLSNGAAAVNTDDSMFESGLFACLTFLRCPMNLLPLSYHAGVQDCRHG